MIDVLATFINTLALVLVWAIIIRALMSWFVPQGSTSLSRILVEVTEPVLGPIRRVLPSFGGFDLSPIIAIVVLQVAARFLVQLLVGSTTR